MKATPFEFRNRFWIFGAFYWIGFTFYSVDHVNAGAFIAQLVEKSGPSRPNSLPLAGVVIAAVFCFLCAALRTWGTAYLKADVMQDASLHAEQIVADGPYRYMRNPLYLGGILLALGMGLMMAVQHGIYPAALLDVTALSVKKLVQNYEAAIHTAAVVGR